MALLNAQLEIKTDARSEYPVLCFVTPQDGGCHPFSAPIACSLMQDRPLFYAKTRAGSFFAPDGWAVRRRDRTHKTGENRLDWGMAYQDYKNFHVVALYEKDVASCEK